MPKCSKQHFGIAKKAIDNMSHLEMARKWRFTPIGDPYFQNGEVAEYFRERFRSLGAMTPEMSKQIGW